MQPDKLQRIASQFPHLNLDWLLTGRAEMLLPQKQKNPDTPLFGTILNSEELKFVNLYDAGAAAGYDSFDKMVDNERIIGQYLVPDFRDIDWLIYVKGSSMYPKYSSGDIIACRVLKESRFIQWGKVYVVATREQGMLVKRLEQGDNNDSIRALSDNPAYRPFDIPKNEILGIALVVGVIRME
jgi:phage repressor protein C with HTH and peptisase S24 domain